ncbi:mitochondrial PGP phosphatase-domain-containing protein [Phellopilus nigrolimitatus]|nr:mitochondrial PGP phosphatase-domain-containing protein [Phellopilus nigrolimitatus]
MYLSSRLKSYRSVTRKDLRFLDFPALQKAGYRGAVFDKDNCLTIPYEDKLVPELEETWKECRSTFGDENILIVSNSAGTRLDSGGIQAESVSHRLGVSVLRHGTLKPGYSCIRDIRAYFTSLKHPVSDKELFVVGDRIFTDVVLANRMRSSENRVQKASSDVNTKALVSNEPDGPLSIFVDKVWKKEAMVMRFLEKKIVHIIERYKGPDSGEMAEQKSMFVRSTMTK